jgi:toxin-antitoxin system PIN domain toxin
MAMNLLDVNVWVAAAWSGHAHHSRVAPWFHHSPHPHRMCRVTQMALLRHLSNPAVLGVDAVSRRNAWGAIDQLLSDPEVTFLDEPPALESVWRALSARDDQSHKLWTDDYLAAFAQTAHLTLVTLDRSLIKRYPSVRVEVI